MTMQIIHTGYLSGCRLEPHISSLKPFGFPCRRHFFPSERELLKALQSSLTLRFLLETHVFPIGSVEIREVVFVYEAYSQMAPEYEESCLIFGNFAPEYP